MSSGTGYFSTTAREAVVRGYITDLTSGAFREAFEVFALNDGSVRYLTADNPTAPDAVGAGEDFDQEVVRVPLAPSESVSTSSTVGMLSAIPANARYAVVHVWDDAISFTIDGVTTPDFAGNGERVAGGGRVVLDNANDITNFSFLSETATGGSIFVKYYNRAPGPSRGEGTLVYVPPLTFANPYYSDVPLDSHEFGRDIDFISDGSEMIVGVWRDWTLGSQVGHVEVLNVSDKTQTKKLLPPVPEVGARFGASVALSHDQSRIAISSTSADVVAGGRARGKVEVLDYSTGALLATIVDPVNANFREFGVFVRWSPDDSELMIGSGDSTLGTARGKVEFYDPTTGGLIETMRSPSPNDFDAFGQHGEYSPDGSKVFVGASANSDLGSRTGRIEVLNRADGSLDRIIYSGNPADRALFGTRFDISTDGTQLIASSPYGSSSGLTENGFSELFDLSSDTVIATFESVAPDSFELFGRGTKFHPDGDKIAFGSTGNADIAFNQGKVEILNISDGSYAT